MPLRVKQALAVGVSILVAIVMLWLGLWQMAAFQRSMDDVAAQRAQMPTVSLADSVAADGTVADIYGRRVTLSGSYLPEYSVLVGTSWPMRVVTLLQLDDGRHIAVVRGTSQSGEPAAPPSGEADLVGTFTAGDKGDEQAVPADAPAGSLSSLRLQSLVQDWPQPLISGYVTLSADDSAAAGLGAAEVVLPEAEGTGMHQGYALQWWVFAGASVAFGIVVARGFGKTAAKSLVDIDNPV